MFVCRISPVFCCNLIGAFITVNPPFSDYKMHELRVSLAGRGEGGGQKPIVVLKAVALASRPTSYVLGIEDQVLGVCM